MKQWFIFCQSNNVNLYKADVPFILQFLTKQFHKGANYGTLNSYRSALSLILGKSFCNGDEISRFLKGVFRAKPCLPKYSSTWDPNLVLGHLSNEIPNDSLTLGRLTNKLVTLLALSTGQRVQTLSLINLKDVHVGESHIIISINEVIKTSAPNKKNPRLIIPFFREKESVCPAATLCNYITKTEQFRSFPNTDKLVLTTKNPIHNASSQSISRWIKQTLRDSGVDVSIFGAHSTRHASTSAANRSGVSIDLIKKAAGWTGNSLCFAKFYNQPIETIDSSFAKAIINNYE